MILTDTHCHLNLEQFDSDRQEVVSRARAAGVSRILNPALDLASSQEASRLAEDYPEVYAAVGVHPNSALTWDEGTPAKLRGLADQPKVVAIGEIGLDYYRDRAPKPVQRQVFERQLGLAAEVELPVVIHNRDATEDVLAVLAEWRAGLVESGSPLAERPGVLHSYAGGLSHLPEVLSLGFYVGITGPVTFRKADELRQVAGALPLERLLIETDAPYLTPEPFRGRRNEPAHVRFVAERIAEVRAISVGELARITAQNAERLFKWDG